MQWDIGNGNLSVRQVQSWQQPQQQFWLCPSESLCFLGLSLLAVVS